MTEIKDLQAGQGSVNVQVTVVSVEDIKTINKYGRDLKLVNAIVTDGTGEIKLTAWNDDVEKVKQGAVLKITNGYVNEFQGEKSLTSGKFGKLEVAGEQSEENTEQPQEKPSQEEISKQFDEESKNQPSEEEVGDY